MQPRSPQSGQLIESLESRTLLSATTTDLYIRLNGATPGNWIHINGAAVTPPKTSPTTVLGKLEISAGLNSASQQIISAITAGKTIKSADMEIVTTTGSMVTVGAEKHFTSVQPVWVSVDGNGDEPISQTALFRFQSSAVASKPDQVASAPAVSDYTAPLWLNVATGSAPGLPSTKEPFISVKEFSFVLRANQGASASDVLKLETSLDFEADLELAVPKTQVLTLAATANGKDASVFAFGSATGKSASWTGVNGEPVTQTFSLAFSPASFRLNVPAAGAASLDIPAPGNFSSVFASTSDLAAPMAEAANSNTVPSLPNNTAAAKLTGIPWATLNDFNINADLQVGKVVSSAQISETLTSSDALKVGQTFSRLEIALGGKGQKIVAEFMLGNVTVTSVTTSLVDGKKTQFADFSAQSIMYQWAPSRSGNDNWKTFGFAWNDAI